MPFFRTLSNWIYALEKLLVSIFVAVLLISLVLGVLSRYVLNSPIAWAGEVSIYAFVWITFLGGSMSIKSREAVAVSILTDKLKGNVLKAVISIGLLLSLIFLVLLSYYGISWITSPSILLQKSDAAQIPMILPYASVVTGLIFMTIHSIYLLLESLTGKTMTMTNDEKVIT